MEEQLIFPFAIGTAGTRRFGNIEPYSGTSPISPDYLLGVCIEIKEKILLTHVGILTDRLGPNLMAGVYSKHPTMDQPHMRLACTPSRHLVKGTNEIAVQLPQILDVGEYWLLVVYSDQAHIRSYSDFGNKIRYMGLNFGNPLPLDITHVIGYNGKYFNYYLVGEKVK